MPNVEHPHTYHSDKMKRCIADLEAKGADSAKAHRICYASLGPEANKIEKAEGDEPCEVCEQLYYKSSRIVAKDEKRRYTLGIVYAPDTLDTDNEFTDAAELEKAAWEFMRELQGRGDVAKMAVELLVEIKKTAEDGDEVQLDIDDIDEVIAKRGVNAMHLEDLEDADVVESYIAPVDMVINGEKIAKGTWLAGIVWGPEHFKKIEAGEWTGYSMGGFAAREKHAD